MHSLINETMVNCIRETGNPAEGLPDRVETMKTLGLPCDRRAENVVIMGCQNLGTVPGSIEAFARVLDKGGMDYTFLSREYCCGNYLYRPAIKARDEEAMVECRSLSREFILKNLDQARALGARRLILFCSPCYPLYKYAFPHEDIIYYPQAIAEIMGSLTWSGGIDYYAGCYRLHRKFAPVSMDLKSTNDVLAGVEGLRVNRISAPSCCFTPEGAAHMINRVETDCMVHICTGCYIQALSTMPDDRDVRILMLSEFIDMIWNPEN